MTASEYGPIYVNEYCGPATEAFFGDPRRIQITVPTGAASMSLYEFHQWLDEMRHKYDVLNANRLREEVAECH